MSAGLEIIRGKIVSHHGIEVNSREDGSVHIERAADGVKDKQVMLLPERDAVVLIDLLGDLTHWNQGDSG